MKLNPNKFDKITSNLDEFNKFLEEFKREILLSIPEVVVKHIEDFHKYQKLVQDFYQKNPELRNHRYVVANLANEIAGKNPDLDPEEVFELVAIKAVKQLKELNNERPQVAGFGRREVKAS